MVQVVSERLYLGVCVGILDLHFIRLRLCVTSDHMTSDC